MAGELDPLIADGTERQPEIQLSAEGTTLENSEDNTSKIAQTNVVTFKDILGLTKEKELLEKIKELNINISCGSCDDTIKIQKLLEILIRNEDFKEYFTPRELSISPIHADDANLFKMELKLKLVAHFVERRKRSAKLLLGDVRTKIKDIKACFSNEVVESCEDEDLIWLLFLDGCSVLLFIHSYVDRRLSVFGLSNGQAALIQQDKLLNLVTNEMCLPNKYYIFQ